MIIEKFYLYLVATLLKAKYTFEEPKNYNLILFDDVSTEHVKELLKNYKYFYLKTRIERICP